MFAASDLADQGALLGTADVVQGEQMSEFGLGDGAVPAFQVDDVLLGEGQRGRRLAERCRSCRPQGVQSLPEQVACFDGEVMELLHLDEGKRMGATADVVLVGWCGRAAGRGTGLGAPGETHHMADGAPRGLREQDVVRCEFGTRQDVCAALPGRRPRVERHRRPASRPTRPGVAPGL
ncbi:hypothetical protein ACFQ0B_76155 [Nonomuraea thailandensis]